MLCSASHLVFIIGLVVLVLAFSWPLHGELLRRRAATDLADIRRQAAFGGLRGLLFRLGYPLVWLLYLPSHGVLITLVVAGLLLVPAWLFC